MLRYTTTSPKTMKAQWPYLLFPFSIHTQKLLARNWGPQEGHMLLYRQMCMPYHLWRVWNGTSHFHLLGAIPNLIRHLKRNLVFLPEEAFGSTVIRLSCIGFTLPKSAILMCPYEVSNKFSGCHFRRQIHLRFYKWWNRSAKKVVKYLDVSMYQPETVYVFKSMHNFSCIEASFFFWQATFLYSQENSVIWQIILKTQATS